MYNHISRYVHNGQTLEKRHVFIQRRINVHGLPFQYLICSGEGPVLCWGRQASTESKAIEYLKESWRRPQFDKLRTALGDLRNIEVRTVMEMLPR